MGKSNKPKGPKEPRPITAKSLQWQSKKYLERYLATSAQLRRVLQRRVYRRLQAFPNEDRAAFNELVEAEVQRCVELGYLNDEKVAELWVEQLLSRGDSRLSILRKLCNKGLSKSLVNDTLAQHDDSNDGQQELLCAIAYARRRGLGPFRREPSVRNDKRQKDLAAMIRAGHGYDYSRQIINTDNITELIRHAESGE
jgi:regulatory protein